MNAALWVLLFRGGTATESVTADVGVEAYLPRITNEVRLPSMSNEAWLDDELNECRVDEGW